MTEYKCINCAMTREGTGEEKPEPEKNAVTCPVCGYMMFRMPYDRREVLLGETVRFVDGVTEARIDEEDLIPAGLAEKLNDFPGYEKIRGYILRAEKTEEFRARVLESVDNIRGFIHSTVRGTYRAKDSDTEPLRYRSDDTALRLKEILPLLGIGFEPGPAEFPKFTADFTETPDRDILPYADDLLDRCSDVAVKIEKFIRANNIYGHSFDVEIDPGFAGTFVKDPGVIDWRDEIQKRTAACDKVIKKRYTVDIEEDGSRQLRPMLKVLWYALYVLMKAPKRKVQLTYRFTGSKRGLSETEGHSPEQAVRIMNDIYASRFAPVREAAHAPGFLADKSEAQMFEIYDKMLDLDRTHFMTSRKGRFVAGESGKKLDALIGLDSVKISVSKIRASALANKGRKDLNLHMCFLGNPGTGKTEVARIIAGILRENGILPTDKVIETDRGGLIAGYVGQTALKTAHVIESAMGGVLFIDEAYALFQGEYDYGEEAIATLIKAMEDHRGEFCVILAGYRNKMEDMLSSNPGFKSRIAFTLEFPNYSRPELERIARMMIAKSGYSASDEAVERMLDITDVLRKDPDFANARAMRNIIEQSVMCRNLRCEGEPGNVIELADVNAYIKDSNIHIPTSAVRGTVLTADMQLDALIGLEPVKRMVKKIRAFARRNKDRQDLNLHMCFLGNPGTGKTEVARILSGVLYEAGAIPEAKLVETSARGLISEVVGKTAKKTEEKVKEAMGGVLFIDEAYSLLGGADEGDVSYGREALAALIKQMEDHRGGFCVILAGYSREMKTLISVNPGLESRIAFTIDFPDYTREELSEIALKFIRDEKYDIEDDALQEILDIAEYYRKRPNFANARTVRNIVGQVIMNQNLRTDGEDTAGSTIILSDVDDYISDEKIDLTDASSGRIGF